MAHLQSGKHHYYVVLEGEQIFLGLATHEGSPYISTHPEPGNLELLRKLPDCGEGPEFHPTTS